MISWSFKTFKADTRKENQQKPKGAISTSIEDVDSLELNPALINVILA